MNIWELSAAEIKQGISDKKFSATQVAKATLERSEEVGKDKLNAFLTLTPELALAAAQKIDDTVAKGEELPPLAGVPIAIKDNMCLEGVRCSCSSKVLENWASPYTGTATAKLLAAGAVPIGKTNLDEFAMGSSTENSAFGPTQNPWGNNLAPGGSSGGSAAAVAGMCVPLATGSDTGGSIRQPASFCGIVGYKPTYGMISRYGLIAFASSLDQIGPFARTVYDAALMTEVMAGADTMDSTSSRAEAPSLTDALKTANLKGVRVGVPKEFMGEGMDRGVRKSINEAIELIKSEGAEIIDVSLPHSEYAIATYYVIATAEASSNLARYDGIHYGHRTETPENLISLYSRSRAEAFGTEVKRRIMLGTYVLSSGYYDAYYLRALKVRALIKQDFDAAFKKCDVILGATSPSVAFKFGERASDPLAMYLSDVYTISANLATLPAISLPCGLGENSLPVGLQMIAPAFKDGELLSAAHAYEVAAGHSLSPKNL